MSQISVTPVNADMTGTTRVVTDCHRWFHFLYIVIHAGRVTNNIKKLGGTSVTNDVQKCFKVSNTKDYSVSQMYLASVTNGR
jgi:hypothetical protein